MHSYLLYFPLHKVLPRGGHKVLCKTHKTGAAITEDVLYKWQTYASSENGPGDSSLRAQTSGPTLEGDADTEDEDAFIPSASIRCWTCD